MIIVQTRYTVQMHATLYNPQADEEIASGQQTMDSPFRRVPSRRRFPRRGSLSNIAAAADEAPPAQTTPSGVPGGVDVLAKREASGEHAGGEAEMEPSVRSQEGDTEARPETGVVGGGRVEGANGDDVYEVWVVGCALDCMMWMQCCSTTTAGYIEERAPSKQCSEPRQHEPLG